MKCCYFIPVNSNFTPFWFCVFYSMEFVYGVHTFKTCFHKDFFLVLYLLKIQQITIKYWMFVKQKPLYYIL